MGKYGFEYPDVSEPVFTSTNVPQSIGETIIFFEHLDEQLSAAISFLMGRGDEIGQIITAELSFKAKVNLLATLFGHERPNSDYRNNLRELSNACLAIEEKRNQVVHSKWRHEFNGSRMTRSKYTARHKHGLQRISEEFTPAQVQAIAFHCGYLAHCVDELLYQEFGHDYGEP